MTFPMHITSLTLVVLEGEALHSPIMMDPTTKGLETLTRPFKKKCQNLKFGDDFCEGMTRQNEMHKS